MPNPQPDWWARWLAIASLAFVVINSGAAFYVFRRKQGRLKLSVRWDTTSASDPVLRVRAALQPVGDPVFVDSVAIHETGHWWWRRDRGTFLTKTTGRGLAATLQPTHYLIAKVQRSIIYRAKLEQYVVGMTIKEGLETNVPAEARRFKVRAWAIRGDGRRFRSKRILVETPRD